jgi:hypothetical protein
MKSTTTIALLLGTLATAQQSMDSAPFAFTSTYTLIASPDAVINPDNQPAPGEAGAIGHYNYGINVDLDIICYNITLIGVTGPYDSPAVTATHIHEAGAGRAGPPRIAFPNPEPADSGPEVVKRSQGCLKGPFETGIDGPNGADTGAGFTLKQIEDNPEGFFTDSHTVKSVPGVVRAQMQKNAAGGAAPPQGQPPAARPVAAPQGAPVVAQQQGNVKLDKCHVQVTGIGGSCQGRVLDLGSMMALL